MSYQNDAVSINSTHLGCLLGPSYISFSCFMDMSVCRHVTVA